MLFDVVSLYCLFVFSFCVSGDGNDRCLLILFAMRCSSILLISVCLWCLLFIYDDWLLYGSSVCVRYLVKLINRKISFLL